MATETNLDISADVEIGMGPLSVSFVAGVPGLDVIEYLWDFGDGYTSRQARPTHIYQSPGIFTVRLDVTTSAGIEYYDIEEDYITVFKVDIESTAVKGTVPFSVKFSHKDYIPEGYTLDSVEWDFKDGSATSTEDSPVHTFSTAGVFPVTITASITQISPADTLSFYSEKRIWANAAEYFPCPKVTGIAWVKNPAVADGDKLILMAVSGPYGNVEDTDSSIKLELQRSGEDYRLVYFNSRSKLINKNTSINIADSEWHLLAYECLGDGAMRFSVDAVEVDPDTGSNNDGLLYSVAQSSTARPGGGLLWVPYLYKSGQGVRLSRVRFGNGFNLGLTWIKEIYQEEKESLI